MSFTISGASLSYTVADFVREVRNRWLEPARTMEFDKLNGAITTGDSYITGTYVPDGIRAGQTIEIDHELMLVWGAGSTANTRIVERGFDGSTADSHADSSLVRIGPRWPAVVIARALVEEVQSWPGTVYALVSGDFTLAADKMVLDLDGLSGFEVLRLCRVQRKKVLVGVPNTDGRWPVVAATIERRQQTTDFPSGFALRVNEVLESGEQLRITVGYKHPIPASVLPTTDLGTGFHLTASQRDICLAGAAARLLVGTESERTDTASIGRGRMAEQVPPGHRLQAGEEGLWRMRDRLLDNEVRRLHRQYAPKVR